MDNTNKIYQAGEVLPTLPGVPTQVANLSTPKPVIPTIEASKLGTAVGNIPATTIPNTANQNLGLQISSSMIQPVAPAPTQTPAPTVDRNTILQSLMDLINKQGTKGEATISAQENAGVFKQQEELTRLQNEYTAKEQAYAKQEEELNKNAEGLSEQGLKIRRDELSRKKNSELADISIQANMVKGLYDTAFSIAEAKINAEFEPIQAQIDGLKNVYSFLQSDLTDSEKLLMQDQINEKQSQADFERQKALLGYKAMIDASIINQNTENAPLYNGLSPATATAVRGKVSSFKSEPIITNFSVIQEANNFVKSLSPTTTNPADDQALIYSLAKALDPNSVVREGEYATAQKYSQSWINAYGKSISQALAGTGFLSDTARANIKKTIESKYDASKVSYDNLYSRYANDINNLTGRSDGNLFITDYSIPQTGNNGTDETEQIFQEVTGTNKSFFGNVFSGIGNFFSRNNSFK